MKFYRYQYQNYNIARDKDLLPTPEELNKKLEEDGE